MSKIITMSVEVTKLPNAQKTINGKQVLIMPLSAFYVHEKSGKIYLQLNAELKDEADQYGNDISLWLSQTKEEREAKANRTFCGNGRTVWSSEDTKKQELDLGEDQGSEDDYSDLPF